jgi:hypothetical protein
MQKPKAPDGEELPTYQRLEQWSRIRLSIQAVEPGFLASAREIE